MFTKEQIKAIENALKPITERDIEEGYCESLDEQGPVIIAGYEYQTSHALQIVDPTAYRCGMADYTSFLLDDLYYEINGSYYLQDEVDDLINTLENNEVEL